jgi:hypothetical protein
MALFAGVTALGCGPTSGPPRSDGGCLGGDAACGTGGGEAGRGGGSGGGAGASGGAGTGGGQTGGAAGGTPGGDNQIVNGDFSDGQTGWSTGSSSNFTMVSIANGQLCATFEAGVLVTVTWGGYAAAPVASVVPGVIYVLSYQVSTNVPLTLEVQVGAAANIWAETVTDFDATTEIADATVQTFSYMFAVPTADPQAGLAFKLNDGFLSGLPMVCLSNVSLTVGAGSPP